MEKKREKKEDKGERTESVGRVLIYGLFLLWIVGILCPAPQDVHEVAIRWLVLSVILSEALFIGVYSQGDRVDLNKNGPISTKMIVLMIGLIVTVVLEVVTAVLSYYAVIIAGGIVAFFWVNYKTAVYFNER